MWRDSHLSNVERKGSRCVFLLWALCLCFLWQEALATGEEEEQEPWRGDCAIAMLCSSSPFLSYRPGFVKVFHGCLSTERRLTSRCDLRSSVLARSWRVWRVLRQRQRWRGVRSPSPRRWTDLRLRLKIPVEICPCLSSSPGLWWLWCWSSSSGCYLLCSRVKPLLNCLSRLSI